MADPRGLIAELGVQFEVSRHVEMVDGLRQSIGFDISLFAPSPAGTDPAALSHTWAQLHEVADALIAATDALDLADGADDIRLTVRAFDGALHHSPKRDFQHDVELVIGVRHAQNYFDPVDREETDGMVAIKTMLREWGAHPAGS